MKRFHSTVRRFITIGAIALVTVLSVGSAHAEHACGPTEDIEAYITGERAESKYAESRIVALRYAESIFEVWVDIEGDTWTLVKRTADVSCLEASGEGISFTEDDPPTGDPV